MLWPFFALWDAKGQWLVQPKSSESLKDALIFIYISCGMRFSFFPLFCPLCFNKKQLVGVRENTQDSLMCDVSIKNRSFAQMFPLVALVGYSYTPYIHDTSMWAIIIWFFSWQFELLHGFTPQCFVTFMVPSLQRHLRHDVMAVFRPRTQEILHGASRVPWKVMILNENSKNLLKEHSDRKVAKLHFDLLGGYTDIDSVDAFSIE